MAQEKRVFLFFLMDEEAQINGCFQDGFAESAASFTAEDGRIALQTADGAKLHALAVQAREGEQAKPFREELNGVWNQFRAVETTALDVRTNLLHQVRLYRAMYEVCYSADGPQEKTVMDGLRDTCYNGGGLILSGDRSTFYDEDGRLVLSDSGESELEAYIVRELPQPEPAGISGEALARRSRTLALLEARHIYTPGWLPVSEAPSGAEAPDKGAVCGRMTALALTALYSDGLVGKKWPAKESRRFLAPYVEAFGADRFFSPKERAYLDQPKPEQDVAIEYSWNYEHAWVMLWAMGRTDTLDFPDHVCDAAVLADIFKECRSFEALVQQGALRPREELLDMADLYFCYNWAVLDVCGQMGLSAPAGMDPSVVYARHKALSWLTEGGDWDSVGTKL